jgi:hypothetical protein
MWNAAILPSLGLLEGGEGNSQRVLVVPIFSFSAYYAGGLTNFLLVCFLGKLI